MSCITSCLTECYLDIPNQMTRDTVCLAKAWAVSLALSLKEPPVMAWVLLLCSATFPDLGLLNRINQLAD